MRFVDDEKKILRHEIHQCVGTRARRPPAKVTGVVLDAVAEAHLLHHFKVKFRALPDALRLDKFVFAFQFRDALVELFANGARRALEFVIRRHELLGGIDRQRRKRGSDVPGERIELADTVNLVAKELHSNRLVVDLCLMHLNHVATHAEFPASEGDIVALVKHVHKLCKECLPRHYLPPLDRDQHLQEIFRRCQPIDAGHAGDNDGVPPGQQRADGRKPEPFDLFVDRRILFNVCVRARDISFRLVIVEIADEVFDSVAGKELFELAVKLRC